MKKRELIFLRLKNFYMAERKRYLFILFLFLSGVLLGCILGTIVSARSSNEILNYFDRFFSAYMLQGIAKNRVFYLSGWNYLIFAFWCWLSGWSIWLLPLGIFQTTVKGFRIGYTIACMLRSYGFKGIVLSLFAILPQTLFLLPALCFYLVSQMQFASDRHSLQKGMLPAGVKRQIYGHHGITTGIFLFILLLCAWIEGYVTPTLLQPLCGFFL